jgi:hypothetical protein
MYTLLVVGKTIVERVEYEDQRLYCVWWLGDYEVDAAWRAAHVFGVLAYKQAGAAFVTLLLKNSEEMDSQYARERIQRTSYSMKLPLLEKALIHSLLSIDAIIISSSASS